MVCIHIGLMDLTIVAGMNEAHKFRCTINSTVFPNAPLNYYYDAVRQAGNFNLSLFDGSRSSLGLS